jgi:C1A family cysteine protease
MKRRYGWKPDLPDQRDFSYKVVAPRVLPEKVDLRESCSTVEDQGYLGSCTACACAGNIEYLENKGIPVPDPLPPTLWQRIISFFRQLFHLTVPRASYIDTSRLFIYYNARAIEGTIEQDAGAYLRDCMKALYGNGHCQESIWPYIESNFAARPPNTAFIDGSNHKISTYTRLTTLQEMLTCLADGYPFVFGITIYESFESNATRITGIVNMPTGTERVLGGHAVMAVGYDQATKRFLVRNSWSTSWGQGGYFTLPYEYVETLGDDFWTIRK